MENKDEFVSPRLKIKIDPHLKAWNHRYKVVDRLHPFFGINTTVDLSYSGMWEQKWAELYLCGHLVSKSLPIRTLEVNHQTLIAIWPRNDAFSSNFCCKWFPRQTLCLVINLSRLLTVSEDVRCPFSGEKREKHFLNFLGIFRVKETGEPNITTTRLLTHNCAVLIL